MSKTDISYLCSYKASFIKNLGIFSCFDTLHDEKVHFEISSLVMSQSLQQYIFAPGASAISVNWSRLLNKTVHVDYEAVLVQRNGSKVRLNGHSL